MAKTVKKTKNVTVTKSHRKANIAVITVASVAVAILIAIAIMCGVHVNPMRGLDAPEYYVLYSLNEKDPAPTNSESQSKMSVALDDMDFTVMSAILQWHWDYSYNFKRDKEEKEKIEISAKELDAIKSTATEYMVELVYPSVKIENGVIDYSTAQSLKVDGETVYFDRVKIVIGNTEGKIGMISMYPYIYERVHNQSDLPDLSPDTYKVTGLNVRADTYTAYMTLKEIADSFGYDTSLPEPEPETPTDETTDGTTTDGTATDGTATDGTAQAAA